MSNWCSNAFELIGPTERIREFEAFLNSNNGKDWFDFFRPCVEGEDWNSWPIQNWGCRWNCDAQDWQVKFHDQNNLSIRFWFDSPEEPPIPLYEFIHKDQSLTIFGGYLNEDLGFVGKFENGFNDYYEYSDAESLNEIPQDVIDEWNLEDLYEEQDATNEK